MEVRTYPTPSFDPFPVQEEPLRAAEYPSHRVSVCVPPTTGSSSTASSLSSSQARPPPCSTAATWTSPRRRPATSCKQLSRHAPTDVLTAPPPHTRLKCPMQDVHEARAFEHVSLLLLPAAPAQARLLGARGGDTWLHPAQRAAVHRGGGLRHDCHLHGANPTPARHLLPGSRHLPPRPPPFPCLPPTSYTVI